MIKSNKLYGVLMTLLLLSACQTATQEGKGIGVVYMHGRGAADPLYGGNGELVRSMESYSVTVTAPKMQWAGSRGEPDYSGSMEDALALVKKEIADLKALGMTTIVIGGMSAGGSSAIGMATRLDEIAGVMAIAPAPAVDVIFANNHPALKKVLANATEKRRIELSAFQKKKLENLEKVTDLIKAGKGNETARFSESNINNQGPYTFDIVTTPNLYFSYIDPNGMRAMSMNTPKLNSKTALLWINDNQGLTRQLGRSYAFDLAPVNPKNRYVELDVLHLQTPGASTEIVKQWLLTLAPPIPKRATPKPAYQ